ncbi:Bifunctional NMN adenylyltransferase/Nudix hydrolase [Enhygromyxa salina]|uniref:Bifunctional NMN adenylyltransferase/Nudix hydrolase n=1 Tax=Enhygromyxa salina TaxID=215803 RepID=A0A2S9XKC2_9BACT|nr:NUDIX domain-containing protein [Enhygromyxa salina]PRP93121.1 Bifunctional NMN adenylyltransferase/Nudix hydrolase [Enhygromyxa salina]
MSHTYEYARAALTVDCVVFGLGEDELEVLLIRRALEPFANRWALPGGFVHIDETLEDAALRELEEETGLRKVYLEQLYSFGAIDRDPRERVVTVAYYALVKLSDHKVRAATDASDAAWFAVSDLPDLAFDHAQIVDMALNRLRAKVRYQPIGFELLAKKFTLTQLQRMYEVILERTLDKRNFRKKILGMDLLVELDEVQKDVAHRAARLYKFDDRRYRKLVKQGFSFEI